MTDVSNPPEQARGYFDPNPYTGEKGPSGLFSTNIPHIDILLNGWQNYKGKDFLANNVGYFPQRDMFKLRESLNDNVTLSERFSNDAVAKSQLNTIRNWMEKFRDVHKGSMRHRLAKARNSRKDASDSASDIFFTSVSKTINSVTLFSWFIMFYPRS